MKKKLLSLLLVLMLMAAVIPSAGADSFSYLVGDPVYIELLYTSGDTTYQFDVDGVPDGCDVYEDGAAGSKGIFLSGTAARPGVYYFSLYASTGESVSHTITVIPQVPQFLSWTRSTGCNVGDNLYLETQISNPSGYEVYYTWYMDDAPLAGADASNLRVDTSEPGTHCFRCVADCYYGSTATRAETDNIWVEIAEKPYVKSIEVKYEPDRIEYDKGEYLDTKGLCLWLNYSDNVQIEEWTDFSCSPTFLNRVGDQKITVKYGSLKTEFYVTVEEPQELESISIATTPVKTTYNVGDKLDTTGLSINANYSDGTTEVLTSDFNCSPTTLKAEGNQIVTVSYENKTCSFNVKVQNPDKVKGISVASMPAKTEYKVGEALDLTGLLIKVEKTSDFTVINAKDSKLSYTPLKLEKAGEQTVTVTYTDKTKFTCNFKINVVERDGSTPKPVTSEKPGAGEKQDPAQQDQKPAEKKDNTLGIALLVITGLALAAGGVFVYMAKTKNGQYRTKKQPDDSGEDQDRS